MGQWPQIMVTTEGNKKLSYRKETVRVLHHIEIRHNRNYGGDSQGKQRLNRCVFRRLRKTDSDDADMTCVT